MQKSAQSISRLLGNGGYPADLVCRISKPNNMLRFSILETFGVIFYMPVVTYNLFWCRYDIKWEIMRRKLSEVACVDCHSLFGRLKATLSWWRLAGAVGLRRIAERLQWLQDNCILKQRVNTGRKTANPSTDLKELRAADSTVPVQVKFLQKERKGIPTVSRLVRYLRASHPEVVANRYAGIVVGCARFAAFLTCSITHRLAEPLPTSRRRAWLSEFFCAIL